MPPAPSISPVLKNLMYFNEENFPLNGTNGGCPFGGHPSLEQRSESFNVKESMTVHCGYDDQFYSSSAYFYGLQYGYVI